MISESEIQINDRRLPKADFEGSWFVYKGGKERDINGFKGKLEAITTVYATGVHLVGTQAEICKLEDPQTPIMRWRAADPSYLNDAIANEKFLRRKLMAGIEKARALKMQREGSRIIQQAATGKILRDQGIESFLKESEGLL